MSKKKRQQPARAPEPPIILLSVWNKADTRVQALEDHARWQLANNQRMANRVVKVEPPKPPLLLPAKMGDLLVGTDGRPLKESL